MDSKRILKNISKIRREIQAKEIQKQGIIDSFYGRSNPDGTGASKGSTVNTSEIKNLKIASITESIEDRRDELILLVLAAQKLVEDLKDPDHRTVLSLKYFSDLTWEEIGDKMHYSPRQAQRIHGDALVAFDNVLEQSIVNL